MSVAGLSLHDSTSQSEKLEKWLDFLTLAMKGSDGKHLYIYQKDENSFIATDEKMKSRLSASKILQIIRTLAVEKKEATRSSSLNLAGMAFLRNRLRRSYYRGIRGKIILAVEKVFLCFRFYEHTKVAREWKITERVLAKLINPGDKVLAVSHVDKARTYLRERSHPIPAAKIRSQATFADLQNLVIVHLTTFWNTLSLYDPKYFPNEVARGGKREGDEKRNMGTLFAECEHVPDELYPLYEKAVVERLTTFFYGMDLFRRYSVVIEHLPPKLLSVCQQVFRTTLEQRDDDQDGYVRLKIPGGKLTKETLRFFKEQAGQGNPIALVIDRDSRGSFLGKNIQRIFRSVKNFDALFLASINEDIARSIVNELTGRSIHHQKKPLPRKIRFMLPPMEGERRILMHSLQKQGIFARWEGTFMEPNFHEMHGEDEIRTRRSYLAGYGIFPLTDDLYCLNQEIEAVWGRLPSSLDEMHSAVGKPTFWSEEGRLPKALRSSYEARAQANIARSLQELPLSQLLCFSPDSYEKYRDWLSKEYETVLGSRLEVASDQVLSISRDVTISEEAKKILGKSQGRLILNLSNDVTEKTFRSLLEILPYCQKMVVQKWDPIQHMEPLLRVIPDCRHLMRLEFPALCSESPTIVEMYKKMKSVGVEDLYISGEKFSDWEKKYP